MYLNGGSGQKKGRYKIKKRRSRSRVKRRLNPCWKINRKNPGGPETLWALAAEDESRIGFAKAGIMKSFQVAQQRQRERLQLSADLRGLLDKQRALPERERSEK